MTDRLRIPVTDDDLTVRSLLKHALEREDFEVTLASDGVEALEAIKRQEFAVMLSRCPYARAGRARDPA